MRCPRCGFQQGEVDECKRCGKSLVKARKRRQSPSAEPARLPEGVHRLSTRHTRDFCRSLGHLLRSGTPLEAALDVLKPTAHKAIVKALAYLNTQLASAPDFATAGAGLMDPALLSIIASFERRGHLGAGLEAVALGLEGRGFVRRRFILVLAYPLFVVAMAIALLPLPTMVQSNMDMSQYGRAVGRYYFQFALCVGMLFWGIPWVIRSTVLGRGLRRASWVLPWPASVYVRAKRALFSKILAHNMEAGMPVPHAVPTAATALGDATVQAKVEAFEQSSSDVGELVGELCRLGLVAPADRMYVSSSMHTGAVGETMEKLAPQYQKQYSLQLWISTGLAGMILFLGTSAIIGGAILDYFGAQLGSEIDGIMEEGPFKDLKDLQLESSDPRETLESFENLDPYSPGFEKQLEGMYNKHSGAAERFRKHVPRAGDEGIYNKGDLKEIDSIIRSR